MKGYVVRGLCSMLLTRGPEVLVEQINLRWPNSVDISDHGWAVAWFSNVSWLTNKSRAIRANKQKLVLIGHSFGGTAICMVAQNLAREGVTIDLLIPIDPAWQYTTVVPNNVKRCVTFVQHTPGQLGQGELKVAEGVSHDRYLRKENHLQIVGDPWVHDKILREVEGVYNGG